MLILVPATWLEATSSVFFIYRLNWRQSWSSGQTSVRLWLGEGQYCVIEGDQNRGAEREWWRARHATSHLDGKSAPGWNWFAYPKPAISWGADSILSSYVHQITSSLPSTSPSGFGARMARVGLATTVFILCSYIYTLLPLKCNSQS